MILLEYTYDTFKVFLPSFCVSIIQNIFIWPLKYKESLERWTNDDKNLGEQTH